MKTAHYVPVTAVLALLLAGCAAAPVPAQSTQEVVVATAAATDQEKLWSASLDVLRELHFVPERIERRSGRIVTEPMTGAQFFEPWRSELQTGRDAVQSSLASIRRTVTVEIKPDASRPGTFVATPTVRVERQSLSERRITAVANFRQAFRRGGQVGTMETDQGIALPRSYWYQTGTDALLARKIADRIAARAK